LGIPKKVPKEPSGQGSLMSRVYGLLAISLVCALIFLPSAALVLWLIYNYAQPIVLGFISIWVAIFAFMGCLGSFVQAVEIHQKEKESRGNCINHE